MKLIFLLFLYVLSPNYLLMGQIAEKQQYDLYHESVNKAEVLIANKDFKEALIIYDRLFQSYSFIFLRDIKVAAQIAVYLDRTEEAFHYLKKGIEMGWEMKHLKGDSSFKSLQQHKEWDQLTLAYEALHNQYAERIDAMTRERVRKMFKKDQKKAMGALLRIGDKSQIKYNETKFGPHSEEQMKDVIEILKDFGYPGERTIGNDYWMSTILSHHNSISYDYNKSDTLYTYMKPELKNAIKEGKISPYEFAMIDDWYIRTTGGGNQPGYGFLKPARQNTLQETDELRKAIGLRSIGLRNKLIEIETETEMDFYLPDWVKGKIMIE